MTQEINYFCNVCGEPLENGRSPGGIGLEHTGDGPRFVECSLEDSPTHICWLCLSSMQNIDPACGEGYRHQGGP